MLALVVALVLVAPQAPPAQTPPAQAPAATRRPAPPPPYNPNADPAAQIATALKSAREDGIRVVVNFGANDDESSVAFHRARRTRDMSFLSSEYKVVNVDVGRLDKNLDVAKRFDVALPAGALPMLVVLDDRGNVLARTSATAFRGDGQPGTYDPAKIVAFFKQHQAPPPPAAEPLLEAAMKQAKAEGKSVFVWFSAPW